MGEFWRLMYWAVLATLVMAPVHALFGCHIVRRGLIFIDLAIAQVAALGMSLAIAYGNDVHSTTSYWYSVGFALGGAFLISLSRFRLGKVPHEAIIGIVYVLSTAASIVVLEFAPTGHGLEELKSMLAGNILFVTNGDVGTTAAIYAGITFVALLLWKPITAITLSRKGEEGSVKAVGIDFVFYALLGLMVATSVKIAGVLVVFSWLVMPAVVAFLFLERMLPAVIAALVTGLVGSLAGLLLSYYAPDLKFGHSEEAMASTQAVNSGNWPTGPAIVVALGAVVVVAYLIKVFIRPKEPVEPVQA
jgi:zinc/manganese transport system permease protein